MAPQLGRVFLDEVGAQQISTLARAGLPQLVAVEAIAERSAVCGDLDHRQAPGDAGLITRGAEFHQQLLARQLHRRQLLEPHPQPLQLAPPYRPLLGNTVAALGQDVELVLLRQQLHLDAGSRLLPRLELYIGRLVWNRLRYLKDPETGKRVSRLNPDSRWIVQDVAGLRIVHQNLWERVKAQQGALEARSE